MVQNRARSVNILQSVSGSKFYLFFVEISLGRAFDMVPFCLGARVL